MFFRIRILWKQFQIPADPQEKIMRIPRKNSALLRKKCSTSQGKFSTSQETIQHFSGKNSALLRKKFSTSQEKFSTSQGNLFCTTDVEPTISQLIS